MKRNCRTVVGRVLAFIVMLLLGFFALPFVLPVPALGAIVLFWYYAFFLCAFWVTAKYMFGAGDVHPILAPNRCRVDRHIYVDV